MMWANRQVMGIRQIDVSFTVFEIRYGNIR